MRSLPFTTSIGTLSILLTRSTAHLIPRQSVGLGGIESLSASSASSPSPSTSVSSAPLVQFTTSLVNHPPSITAYTVDPTPSADVGLGFFQLRDSDAAIVEGNNHITHSCQLTSGGSHILDCNDPPTLTLGDNYCVDLNGRHSYPLCAGVLTVDFASTPDGDTYIHYTAANGSYVGCTSKGKSSSASCINNEFGQGQFGSPDYVGDWCVVDVTQYQKKDPGQSAAANGTDKGQYGYAISIYDSATDSTASGSKNGRNLIASTTEGGDIGGEAVYGAAGVAETVGFGNGKLVGDFSITSGKVDSDPFTLSYSNPYLSGTTEPYGTETFNAYDTSHQCSLANVYPNGGKGNTWGYDGGKRSGTCGFKC